MKLVVFGANGPTGRLLTRMAAGRGHTVTAVTRKPDDFPAWDGVRVAGGDVLDISAVREVVAGHDAVVSTLGLPYTKEPVTLYSQGMANILEAMTGHDVRRLVCVTSIGVSGESAPDESLVWRKVIAPVLLAMGRTIYEDMRRMEELVRASVADWTVVRPAGLFDADAVSAYQVAEKGFSGRFTSRADLADALLREAVEDLNVGRCVDVITTEGTPGYVGLFVREALHIGK
ncbi:SDR family oxidoreductase [Nonomuraea sp. NBC_01738]|uniref:NAD(P)-dependent oxidoreductase n=1 Tax=Nonomuraea sp. NBC_01738 TaxID=2976003 RepID=UPI002E14FCEF|nr:SDR family oxidoreductase [Nonomuraea sp. NBC_01738]